MASRIPLKETNTNSPRSKHHQQDDYKRSLFADREQRNPDPCKRALFVDRGYRVTDRASLSAAGAAAAAVATAATASASGTGENSGTGRKKQPQVYEYEDENLREWRRDWRRIMAKSTIFFDCVDKSTIDRYWVHMEPLGTRFTKFFDNNVTHLITRRSKDADYPASDIISKARKHNITVWTCEKFTRFTTNLLGYDPLVESTAPDQSLGKLLREEKLVGPSDRDPSAKRDDYCYFKGPYLLVWDPRHYNRPTMYKEFPVTKGDYDHAWPYLRYHSRVRSPFLFESESEEAAERRRRRRRRLAEAAAKREADLKAITDSKNTNMEKPRDKTEVSNNEDPKIHKRTLAPAGSRPNFTSTTLAMLGSLRKRPNEDPDNPASESETKRVRKDAERDTDGSKENTAPSTNTTGGDSVMLGPPSKHSLQVDAGSVGGATATANTSMISNYSRTYVGEGKSRELIASGINLSTATSATKSVVLSGDGNTNNGLGATVANTSREVANLKKKVLNRSFADSGVNYHLYNNPPKWKDDDSKRAQVTNKPDNVGTISGSTTTTTNNNNNNNNTVIAAAAVVSAGLGGTGASTAKKGQKTKTKCGPGSRLGYCENCAERFEDYRVHTNTSKHRRFATDDRNFRELDDLLQELDSYPFD